MWEFSTTLPGSGCSTAKRLCTMASNQRTSSPTEEGALESQGMEMDCFGGALDNKRGWKRRSWQFDTRADAGGITFCPVKERGMSGKSNDTQNHPLPHSEREQERLSGWTATPFQRGRFTKAPMVTTNPNRRKQTRRTGSDALRGCSIPHTRAHGAQLLWDRKRRGCTAWPQRSHWIDCDAGNWSPSASQSQSHPSERKRLLIASDWSRSRFQLSQDHWMRCICRGWTFPTQDPRSVVSFGGNPFICTAGVFLMTSGRWSKLTSQRSQTSFSWMECWWTGRWLRPSTAIPRSLATAASPTQLRPFLQGFNGCETLTSITIPVPSKKSELRRFQIAVRWSQWQFLEASRPWAPILFMGATICRKSGLLGRFKLSKWWMMPCPTEKWLALFGAHQKRAWITRHPTQPRRLMRTPQITHKLPSITIPDSMTKIAGWAFFDCSGLETVTIPHTVTSIGESAYSCNSLKSATIPGSVTSIGDYAFHWHLLWFQSQLLSLVKALFGSVIA